LKAVIESGGCRNVSNRAVVGEHCEDQFTPARVGYSGSQVSPQIY
jgi:hypothetical protein